MGRRPCIANKPIVIVIVIELYKEIFKRLLFLNRLWEFDQTQQEWSLGSPIPK